MHPAALLSSLGKDLSKRAPEAERTVANRQHRRPHTASFEITQHLRPRLGRFSKAIPDRDQLLVTVGAHPQQAQATPPSLPETDAKVAATSPQANGRPFNLRPHQHPPPSLVL